MGRPLNKKYFGNTNYQDTGFANVGGEGIASVTIDAPIAASMNTGATVTFSAPQLTNGQAATGTVTIDGNGDISAITITSAGSGYTDVTAITITVTDTVAGGAETETLIDGGSGVSITLTNTRQNSIKCEAQVGSGSEVTTGDIIKQVSTKRYKVQTSDGTAVCKLVTTTALGANEMSIAATDSDGKTYLVSKLTARKAILVPTANAKPGFTTSAGTQFASGTSAKWSFTATIEGSQVRLYNE